MVSYDGHQDEVAGRDGHGSRPRQRRRIHDLKQEMAGGRLNLRQQSGPGMDLKLCEARGEEVGRPG